MTRVFVRPAAAPAPANNNNNNNNQPSQRTQGGQATSASQTPHSTPQTQQPAHGQNAAHRPRITSEEKHDGARSASTPHHAEDREETQVLGSKHGDNRVFAGLGEVAGGEKSVGPGAGAGPVQDATRKWESVGSSSGKTPESILENVALQLKSATLSNAESSAKHPTLEASGDLISLCPISDAGVTAAPPERPLESLPAQGESSSQHARARNKQKANETSVASTSRLSHVPRKASRGSASTAGQPGRNVPGSTSNLNQVRTKTKVSPPESKLPSPRDSDNDGYNSGDEHIIRPPPFNSSFEYEEEKDRHFQMEIFKSKNLVLRRMEGDGNCLFRAISDQIYGDPEAYNDIRQMCVDYMEKERDHFSQFVTESFTSYCKRKRRDKVFGNNLEIQAMAEMFNRPIHIFSYSTEPINIFHGQYHVDLPPIRLSYHRRNHYNSLIDPNAPAYGAGLGFGNLRGSVSPEAVKAAIKSHQDHQIEKALLDEGRLHSDLDLTQKEMDRYVYEASLRDFTPFSSSSLHPFPDTSNITFSNHSLFYSPPFTVSSTLSSPSSNSLPPLAGPSSSNVFGNSGSAEASSLQPSKAESSSSKLTENSMTLISMGFEPSRVLKASSIFGDDLDNMLCFLLESGYSGSLKLASDHEVNGPSKGKATQW